VRSVSSTSFCLIALAIAVGGCTRSAPDLPPDYGSVNASRQTLASFPAHMRNLNCAQIASREADLEARNQKAEEIIKSNRTRNQVAGYLGALYLVPVVAIENDEDQKALLDKNQREVDQLKQLQRVKRC